MARREAQITNLLVCATNWETALTLQGQLAAMRFIKDGFKSEAVTSLAEEETQ
jgi:hypothetical protein